jgi:arginine decarboxylase
VLETVVQGDTVREVLDYVQYNSQNLVDKFRKDVETAVREQRIGYEEAGRLLKFYEEGLQGYTYLEQ